MMDRNKIINEADEFQLFRYATLYSELKGKIEKLREINPNIMRYETVGKTNFGNDILLVTITDEDGMKNLEKYKNFMKKGLENPQKTIKMLEENIDCKIPVFLNCNLHGNEISGTDAALLLIEKIVNSYDNDEEVKKILKDTVILINICSNPDGRIKGTYHNGNCVDLNRDFFTQSQPETKTIVKIATEWFPTSMIDFHGFFGSRNGIIEPCTPPHNPNFEYDLILKYSLEAAERMAKEIYDETELEFDIPLKDYGTGWDDYAPVYTPGYFIGIGTLAHTIEFNFPDGEGFYVGLVAAWANLKYVSENKYKLLKNQFEIYRRGKENLQIRDEIKFPYAYIIPMNKKEQKDPLQASKMISKLLYNKIEVYKTEENIEINKKVYGKGSYIVYMNQSLRGMANAMLWEGENLNDTVEAMYDISIYSYPLMSRFDCIKIDTPTTIKTSRIYSVPKCRGDFHGNINKYYLIPIENNDAFTVANLLMKKGYSVGRLDGKLEGYNPGTFVIKYNDSLVNDLLELSKKYYVCIKDEDRITADIKPLKLLKTAIIGDNYGAYNALKEMEFDVTPISYSWVNRRFDLEKAGFEALIFGGSEKGIWDDQYQDKLGVSYGQSWALIERGRKKVLQFVESGHPFIGIGFAGAKINEITQNIDVEYAYTQTAENGICSIALDPNDPIAYSYNKEELALAYAPVWFTKIGKNVEVCAKFSDRNFYKAGYWKDNNLAQGKPIMVRDVEKKVVLLGIDPSFRNYTPGTYRIIANALYYISR